MDDLLKDEVITWLHSLTKYGIKLGLDNIRELLNRIGNPQKSFKSIHVAGSDGKGSVCSTISAILSESGMKVGMYSSPHLMDFNERIQIRGQNISDDDLLLLAHEIMIVVECMKDEGMQCTFFESVTAMAFLYFQRKNVDYAVIEVGIGGRYDATNIIDPVVSVITNVSGEHKSVLGETVTDIAFEKAGIIKSGIPIITSNTGKILEVISKVSEEKGSPLIATDKASMVSLVQNGSIVEYGGREYFISIPGSYQAVNLPLVLETLKILPEWDHVSNFVDKGLKSVSWKGRMQKIDSLPLIIDVTHTAAGMKYLCEDISEIYGKVNIVFGVLSDKDLVRMAESVSKMGEKIYIALPHTERDMDSEEMMRVMNIYSEDVTYCDTVDDAIEAALKEDRVVLVTGSLRMAECAFKWLKKRSV